MKILIATDAWDPQINGVVTTYKNLMIKAAEAGDCITLAEPGNFPGFPMPGYKEIKISFPDRQRVRHDLLAADAVHIATPEGTLGNTYRKQADIMGVPYTAACHTKIPEFIRSRVPGFPVKLGWHVLKNRSKNAKRMLVPTSSMVDELKAHGYANDLVQWTRGVDRRFFKFVKSVENKRPVLLNVGRVSHEKNLSEFYDAAIPFGKIIQVGDGPAMSDLRRRYPEVEFVGKKTGHELAKYYQQADVFVFPSKLDTFGVVMIEAMACGTPIAAYNVTGPKDVVIPGANGFVDENLHNAIESCLCLDRQQVYNESLKYTWETCYDIFRNTLVPKG